MTLREEFEKETGKKSYLLKGEGDYSLIRYEYVRWLEEQIPIREKKAFDAAREVASSDEGTNYFKYETVEDWRKEK